MESFKEHRSTQLSDLEKFINESSDRLKSIVGNLNWTVDVLKEKGADDMVSCPLNPEHRMPQRSLDKHLEKCSLLQEGYKVDEEFLSSPDFSSSPAVVFDKHSLQQVLEGVSPSGSGEIQGTGRSPARTSSRFLTDFTAAERSALHAHVVSKTKQRTDLTVVTEDLYLPFPGESRQTRPKSKLELLAEQRDAKRRRMNHKKVHTSRKTHLEILREVIRNQMEYLTSQDTNIHPESSTSALSGEVLS